MIVLNFVSASDDISWLKLQILTLFFFFASTSKLAVFTLGRFSHSLTVTTVDHLPSFPHLRCPAFTAKCDGSASPSSATSRPSPHRRALQWTGRGACTEVSPPALSSAELEATTAGGL